MCIRRCRWVDKVKLSFQIVRGAPVRNVLIMLMSMMQVDYFFVTQLRGRDLAECVSEGAGVPSEVGTNDTLELASRVVCDGDGIGIRDVGYSDHASMRRVGLDKVEATDDGVKSMILELMVSVAEVSTKMTFQQLCDNGPLASWVAEDENTATPDGEHIITTKRSLGSHAGLIEPCHQTPKKSTGATIPLTESIDQPLIDVAEDTGITWFSVQSMIGGFVTVLAHDTNADKDTSGSASVDDVMQLGGSRARGVFPDDELIIELSGVAHVCVMIGDILGSGDPADRSGEFGTLVVDLVTSAAAMKEPVSSASD
ncbi:hypothetical protein BX600DRAFT_521150 [Xylariales sp. PMI_506]|nr:hypothetical protein BX600DRAFT_521150 [Xylariales sp. PMI_506]